MNSLKLNENYSDLEKLLAETTALLLEDPSDQKAAAMLLSLIEQGTIDGEVARYLYEAAVRRVYFSGG